MSETSTRLALVRHTRVAVASGICYGRSDLPAAPFAGAEDAIVECLEAFAPTQIRCSPLQRCRVLADRVAAVIDVPVVIDDRLVELDFGAWEGRRWDDLPRAALDRWAADPLGFAAPGGETGAALVARVSAAFDAIRAGGGAPAVIAHAGPLRVLASLAAGRPIDLLRSGPALGSVTLFEPISSRSG